MNRTMLCAGAAMIVLSGCQGEAPVDTAQIEKQLKQSEGKWNNAYARRDAAAIAAMYADDAALATPNANLATGKDAIATSIGAISSDPNFRMEFASDKVQVAASGNLAYTRGRYTLTTTNPSTRAPVVSTGNYLTVWKRQGDGSWRAVEDFAVPGAPPTVASRAQALPR